MQDDKDCQLSDNLLLSTALLQLWVKASIQHTVEDIPAADVPRLAARRITEGEFSGTFANTITRREKRWLGNKRTFGGVECSNLFFFVVKLMRAWREGLL